MRVEALCTGRNQYRMPGGYRVLVPGYLHHARHL